MEVNAVAYVKYKETSISESLKLYVKFKIDNKFFNTKLEKTLVSRWWDKYNGNDELYMNDLIIWVSNKQLLINVSENMIKEYFVRNEENKKFNSKVDQFNKLYKDLGKIEIKVKIK